ncbi:hypothetical protein DFJ63DRAFT_319569 [Scheffersomyces coipomensis]|uniref:uncharacterized protein n=1 Tax=Scheffersomyces coipomensis TaxID=1788519 RepID=UPI00315DBFB9
MFNGAATNEGLNTIMNIKNYLPINGQLTSFSTFFDTFAKDWIANVNYESLIKSIFCTTNVDSLEESYCLRIKDNKSLHIFPAFYDITKFIADKANKHLQKLKTANTNPGVSKREVVNDDENSEIESQAFRQIHNRLSNVADHVGEVTFELSTDPKPVFERLDERIDQKLDSAFEKINAYPNRLNAKKDSLKERIDAKKDNIKEEFDLSKMVLDEKKTNFENKLRQAFTSRLKKYKFKPHIFEKVKQQMQDSDDFSDDYYYQQLHQLELEHQQEDEQETHQLDQQQQQEEEEEELHRYENDPDHDYVSKRSTFFEIEQDNLKHKHIEGGLVLPLSLIKIQERFIESPRNKRFSQIVFDIKDDPSHEFESNQRSDLKRVFHKRDSIYSEDEDCQKITWYNIFHYSIFGKPKFCINQ